MAGAAQPGGDKTNSVKGPINMKNLSSFKDKLEKTGVVYLSRVPPYMKAQKIRHLLSKYGEIGRIYLTPEDPAIRKKRKAMGGNKKQVTLLQDLNIVAEILCINNLSGSPSSMDGSSLPTRV